MIKFKVLREYIGRYHERYQTQVLFWKYVPGNGRVRGRVVSVRPEGLGPKVEVVMSLEECVGFQPRKQPFSTSESFKWVGGDEPAQACALTDKLRDIEYNTYEQCDFVVSLRALSKQRGTKPTFTVGDAITLDGAFGPTSASGRTGWVTRAEVDPSNPFQLRVCVRLKPQPQYEMTMSHPPCQMLGRSPLQDVGAYLDELKNFEIDGLRMTGEMSFPINWLEETDDMKIYDAVVVKVDEKGTPTEILKVVPPFLAPNDQAAKTAVTVDYATENTIAGKDLTGIAVVVRSFQSVG